MAALLASAGCRLAVDSGSATRLLNVSYDPTRELYAEYNRAFGDYWKGKTGQTIRFSQSNGASGKQSQAVMNGLPADVVTLGIPPDIDAIAKTGLLTPDWRSKLPNHSEPYTSTIVFLVRQGNPKNIHDWPDLIRSDVRVITPNPKVSSGGRWNYLAAWGYALRANNNSDEAACDFVTRLYHNVPVLDTGARAATQTFAEGGQGDVLLSWENEALLAVRKLGADKFAVVVPPVSILAEPPVAVVDKNVDFDGTRAIAEAYLRYLYSPTGQAIIARNGYRPLYPQAVAPEVLKKFAPVRLFRFESVFPDWETVQKTHFRDGGIFGPDLSGARLSTMRRSRRLLPGFPLTLGITLFSLTLVVLIPLSTIFVKAAQLPGPQFIAILRSPEVAAAFRLTFGASLIAATVNAAFGLLIAWVLTRYQFPGATTH